MDKIPLFLTKFDYFGKELDYFQQNWAILKKSGSMPKLDLKTDHYLHFIKDIDVNQIVFGRDLDV